MSKLHFIVTINKNILKIIGGLLLALIIGRFVIVGMPKIIFNHISSDGDESAYLSLGLDLLEEGVMSDGTRPPLYSAILLPVAEREWSYFTSAKLITLGVGVLTILATVYVGVRLFGWQAALMAAFLLAINKEFHVRSTTVYADVLLALVIVGAWYYLIKSIDGWRQSILGGVFVGLSFLTKGSAPVLLAAWGMMALVHYRFKIFRQFHLLLVPLFFVIVSTPLLIYNARTFGSSTYNFATQHIMWMDRLEQINTENPEDLPTAATYFATHTPADMVERVEKGLRRLNPVISRSVIPNRTFEPAWQGPVLGILAVGVLIYLVLFRRTATISYFVQRKNAYLYTLFLYALFYPFFTWYVAGSSAETRFVIPLLAPLYLLLADATVTIIRGLGERLTGYRIPRMAYQMALLTIIGWAALWMITTAWQDRWALFTDPYLLDRELNVEEEQMVQWLSTDNPDQAALVAFGPSKSLPLWKFPRRFDIERLPVDIDTWDKMETYIAKRQPDYLVLDEDTVRRRRQALSEYFQYQRDPDLISFEQVPPNWTLNYIHQALPCRWCIFTPIQAQQPPLATFANDLNLIDWRLIETSKTESNNELALASQEDSFTIDSSQFSIVNSSPLHVSLTWQPTTSLSTDYTFFVHLTAPDGFVKAQQDQPPQNGLWPTSRWATGTAVSDQFELSLETVQPGEYLILAGLYDRNTGERVPLVNGDSGPAPATVLLGEITVTSN